MDLMNLVKFVVAGEEGEEGEHLEEDAADSPVVHLVVVVTVSQQAFRRPIPPSRYIFCEGSLRIDSSAGSEISKFHLIVFDQNILPNSI